MSQSQPVIVPCPHEGCGKSLRIRRQGEKVVWTPAGCPSCKQVYHGTETFDLSRAQPAPEHW